MLGLWFEKNDRALDFKPQASGIYLFGLSLELKAWALELLYKSE